MYFILSLIFKAQYLPIIICDDESPKNHYTQKSGTIHCSPVLTLLLQSNGSPNSQPLPSLGLLGTGKKMKYSVAHVVSRPFDYIINISPGV